MLVTFRDFGDTRECLSFVIIIDVPLDVVFNCYFYSTESYCNRHDEISFYLSVTLAILDTLFFCFASLAPAREDENENILSKILRNSRAATYNPWAKESQENETTMTRRYGGELSWRIGCFPVEGKTTLLLCVSPPIQSDTRGAGGPLLREWPRRCRRRPQAGEKGHR